jgi:hypothetical protein
VHVECTYQMHIRVAVRDQVTQVVHPAHEVLGLARYTQVLGERWHCTVVDDVRQRDTRERKHLAVQVANVYASLARNCAGTDLPELVGGMIRKSKVTLLLLFWGGCFLLPNRVHGGVGCCSAIPGWCGSAFMIGELGRLDIP